MIAPITAEQSVIATTPLKNVIARTFEYPVSVDVAASDPVIS
jgi:LDH2 family malate/lactate/ureidoglycolate dehydrogenase